MAHLTTDFCRRVAKARRAKGMTQSVLAQETGCKQSAISMFERGHSEKLSLDFVRKIADILEIPIEETQNESCKPGISLSAKKGYCPNPSCLSNIPYVIDGDLVFWPTVRETGESQRYCKVCGEVMEHSCAECGQRVDYGAFCTACGKPRVTPLTPPEISLEQWINQRRREILQWRELTDEKNSYSH